jgi:hypothetical protein
VLDPKNLPTCRRLGTNPDLNERIGDLVKSEIGLGLLLQSRIRMLTLVDVSNGESARLLRFRPDMERLDELSIYTDTF